MVPIGPSPTRGHPVGTVDGPYGWWGTRCALGHRRGYCCCCGYCYLLLLLLFLLILFLPVCKRFPRAGASEWGDARPPQSGAEKVEGRDLGRRRRRGETGPSRGTARPGSGGHGGGTGVSPPGQVSPSSGRCPAEPPRRSVPARGPAPPEPLEFVFRGVFGGASPRGSWGDPSPLSPGSVSLCRAAGGPV